MSYRYSEEEYESLQRQLTESLEREQAAARERDAALAKLAVRVVPFQSHRQERDKLRELLRKAREYSQHTKDCYALHMKPDLKCNCGLQPLLDEIAALEPQAVKLADSVSDDSGREK